MSLLEIKNLSLGFKGVKALSGISIEADPGKITAVIGPNGAGKTSLFNCISGLYHPQEGSIDFDGNPLLGQKPTTIAERGVARTFQNLALFEYLTVLENIQLGRHSHYRSHWWQDLFFSSSATSEELKHRAFIEDIIDFLNLESVRDMPVSVLPYGILKRVELARADRLRRRRQLLGRHHDAAHALCAVSGLLLGLLLDLLLDGRCKARRGARRRRTCHRRLRCRDRRLVGLRGDSVSR